MNDKKYFDNIGQIQAIISRLDSEELRLRRRESYTKLAGR